MLTRCNFKRRVSAASWLRRAGRLWCIGLLVCVCAPAALADRLLLTDGTALTVDEAWADAQGIWYRRGGVTYQLDRARVQQIERAPHAGPEAQPKRTQLAQLVDVDAATTAAPAANSNTQPAGVPGAPADDATGRSAVTSGPAAPPPLWIYLVGGARFEVDEATETPEGVWYKRGNLSIFIDRVRVVRVERAAAADVAAVQVAGRPVRRERRWSTGNARLDALIRQSGGRYGVDPYLVFCVMEQESHFNPQAVSPAGARGLMQLMPATAARFGVRRVHDPAQNVMGGTRYLRELLGRFNGRVDLVLASYNAGAGAVLRYGQRVPPYRETRNYVRKVGGRYGGFSHHAPVTATAAAAAAAATRPSMPAPAPGSN